MNLLGFNGEQWIEIFLGISHGINIFKYTDKRKNGKHLSAEQMREVREGLEEKLNVSYFNELSLTSEEMWMIRALLRAGIYEDKYFACRDFSSSYEGRSFKTLYRAYTQNVDINKLFDEGYDANQVIAICEYLPHDTSIMDYINVEKQDLVIHLIGKALQRKLDVSGYVKLVVLRGVYYPHEVKKYIEMQINGFDVQGYLKKGYDLKQIEQIELGKRTLKEGTEIYENPKYSVEQMLEIRVGLEKGLDVSIYANEQFDNQQMRIIRNGLEIGLNAAIYSKSWYTTSQMSEIFNGLSIMKKYGVHVKEELK